MPGLEELLTFVDPSPERPLDVYADIRGPGLERPSLFRFVRHLPA
jgi:hypothetical protein